MYKGNVPVNNNKVKGYTITSFLGYSRRARFTGKMTKSGDIKARMFDGRIMYIPMAEAMIYGEVG